MTEQHNAEELPESPPSRTPPTWRWALLLAIPVGFIGTYLFGLKGLDTLRQFGYLTDKEYGDWIFIVMTVCLGGLAPAVLGAILGGLASWPLGKVAGRWLGWVGVLLAGLLAGVIGSLLITAAFLWFVML